MRPFRPQPSSALELPPEEKRAVQKIQLLVLLAINGLLAFVFYWQRMWRQTADEHHWPLVLHGWDSWAWLAWIAAAPLMLILIRRYPLTRGQLPRSLVGLTVGSVLIYVGVVNIRFGLRVLPDLWLPVTGNLPANWIAYLNTTLTLLPIDFLAYCGFFAVTFAIDYHFKFRQHAREAAQLELQTARLQSDLSQAELAALRSQLDPHFLFNSFNALATLVRQKKNEMAAETIVQLSALFRMAMERRGLAEVPLEEELDFARHYLEVERVRFGDKLQLDFAVEPAALEAMVPNLILQPLIENAIKHGISQRTSPGWVRIAAARDGGQLVVEVSNDAPDAPAAGGGSAKKRTGVGLANTRARLNRLYGPDYDFRFISRPGGTVDISLRVPWRASPRLAEVLS